MVFSKNYLDEKYFVLERLDKNTVLQEPLFFDLAKAARNKSVKYST